MLAQGLYVPRKMVYNTQKGVCAPKEEAMGKARAFAPRWLLALIGVSALLLALPVARAQARVNRALLVGMDTFVTKASTYPSSINNVYAMQAAFQGSLEPFGAILIPDTALATPEAMTELIRQTFAGAAEDDVSYFYISTHGVYDGQSEPALLLSDGQTETRMTARQLEQAFSGIAGTKVLLIDACNSGAFIGKGESDFPGEVAFLGDDFKVLCSSGAHEESWYWNAEDSEAERGRQGAFYFTQALAQSLSAACNTPADQNRDGAVTLSELYEYLLQNHAASTPQVYPQTDDFVVFRYDPAVRLPVSQSSPIQDVTFSGTVLGSGGDEISVEFTALRPVRVAYQVVYYRGGQWRFDEAQLIYDREEQYGAAGDQAGAVSAGRKARTLSLRPQSAGSYGYVLVQLVTQENYKLTVHAGRILCVSPASGRLDVAVSSPDLYRVSDERELPIFVRHRYPCQLSVAIVDAEGTIVRRLSHRQSTRPLGLEPPGSTFYWDGMDKHGNPVPPGTYYVRASGAMDELSYTTISAAIEVLE